MVFLDDYLLKPVLSQGFIEFCKTGRLLFDVILQHIDVGNLCVSSGGGDRALLMLLVELENSSAISWELSLLLAFEKFRLEFHQHLINNVSSGFSQSSDDFSDVLLELDMYDRLTYYQGE